MEYKPRDENYILVNFHRFYPGFSPKTLWIPLIEFASGREVKLVAKRQAELTITSVFESWLEMWALRLLSKGTGMIP